MKKLLAIFAATGMVATSGISVVACNSSDEVMDKEGLLKVNPSTEKEIITILNSFGPMIERYIALSDKISKSEIAELYSKFYSEGAKSFSDEEKAILVANEDWNQYLQDIIVQGVVEYKVYQFYASLSKEDAETFLSTNKELITSIWDESFTESAEMFYENETEIMSNLSVEDQKVVMNSSTIAISEKAIEWIKDNKFKKS